MQASLIARGTQYKMTVEVEVYNGTEPVQNGKTNDYDLKPLSKQQEKEDTSDPVISILGNGNYGKALAVHFSDYGMPVCIGSRDPTRRKFLPRGSTVVSYQEAAQRGEFIFVCIPVSSYEQILPDLRDSLAKKIVVDVSNPSHSSERSGAFLMASLLPDSYVMKGLNTLSAWALESDSFGGSRETYICGNHRESRVRLIQLLQEVGFTPVDAGRLKVANKIEKRSLKLFPEWRCALVITAVVTLLLLLYYYLRIFGAYKETKHLERLALYHADRMICWIALWLFSLVYLPGCLAGYIQIARGTKYKPFPSWLDQWMKSRKQLGLIALLCGSMHGCLGLLVLAAEQVEHMSHYVLIPGTGKAVFQSLEWNGQISLLFATLALATFAVLGITSLPTVNAKLSWKEWDFIQSFLGYTGLIFATTHVLVYGYTIYDKDIFKFFKWDMPPAVFLMPLLPLLVLFLKLILLLPGIYHYLKRIRNGYERHAYASNAHIA